MIKNRLKDDIKFMLTSLISKIEDTNEDYNSLISEIYNELDNLSITDLYVTREYVKDSVNSLTSEKQVKKHEKSMLAGRMKVISDDAGNFYVVTEEAGQEKIVMQTDDKAKADQYVQNNQNNAAMAAAPEDELEDDFTEDPTDVPKDDLPETNVDENDSDELDVEEETEEEEVDSDLLDSINELTERADHLISAIDNSIDVVPDLDAITELVNIKVSIQDKIDELNSTDPTAPDLDESMEALRNELEEHESSALDIINKNAPGNEKETAEENNESVEEQAVVEEEVEVDDAVDDDEDNKENNEEWPEEEFEESVETEEFNDEEDLEEESEEDIDELINDLLNSVEDIEEKVEDVKEAVEETKPEEDIAEEEFNSEEFDDMLDEEFADEEEFIDEEESEDKTLESSVLNPFDWDSLEDGEEKDSSLESDTPTDKMIPEDDGVQDVGREKPDKKPDEELPLDGENPLEAGEVEDYIDDKENNKPVGDDKESDLEEEDKELIPEDDGVGDKDKEEIGKEDKELIPDNEGVGDKDKSEVSDKTDDNLLSENEGVGDKDKEEIGKEDKELIPEDEGVQEVGREKPDKKPDEELPLDGENPLEAGEVLPDGTELSSSWIQEQLENAGIEFEDVLKTAPGEYEIVSGFDTKYGEEWEDYESRIYDMLENAGWNNEDSIFIV